MYSLFHICIDFIYDRNTMSKIHLTKIPHSLNSLKKQKFTVNYFPQFESNLICDLKCSYVLL